MGSPSDMAHCEKIEKKLRLLGVACEKRITSAHKGDCMNYIIFCIHMILFVSGQIMCTGVIFGFKTNFYAQNWQFLHHKSQKIVSRRLLGT